MTDAIIPTRSPGRSVDPAGLAVWVIRLLWVYLGMSVLGLLAGLYEQSVLAGQAARGPLINDAAMMGSDAVVGIIAILELLAYVVSGFLTLKWMYRTTLNAKALAPGLERRPGWTIGWYFIPFANLVMPFRVMNEIWRISTDPARWRTLETPGILRLWWGLWLVAGFLGNISFRLQMRAATVQDLQVVGAVNIVSELVGIPLILVLIRIVRYVTDRQVAALQQNTFD